MIKTVLCAVDVDRAETDAAVLKTAHKLALSEKAQLDVITVIPDVGMPVVGSYFEETHMEKAQEKRGKTDTVDAAAICEAVTRPTMRFVAV